MRDIVERCVKIMRDISQDCDSFKDDIRELTHVRDVRTDCYDVFKDTVDCQRIVLVRSIKGSQLEAKRRIARVSRVLFLSIFSMAGYFMTVISPLYFKDIKDLNEIIKISSEKLKIDMSNWNKYFNVCRSLTRASYENHSYRVDGEKINIKDGRIKCRPYTLVRLTQSVIRDFHRWNMALAERYCERFEDIIRGFTNVRKGAFEKFI